MFHDIGTTPENISATKLSFEFYGGFLVKEALSEWGSEKGQMESVVESVIRHQDLGTTGTLSRSEFSFAFFLLLMTRNEKLTSKQWEL